MYKVGMGGRVAGADQYADDCLASKDGCRCQSIQADTQIGKVVVGYFPKNGLAVRVGPNDANGSHICFLLHDGDGLGKTTLTGWYSRTPTEVAIASTFRLSVHPPSVISHRSTIVREGVYAASPKSAASCYQTSHMLVYGRQEESPFPFPFYF